MSRTSVEVEERHKRLIIIHDDRRKDYISVYIREPVEATITAEALMVLSAEHFMSLIDRALEPVISKDIESEEVL